MILARRWDLSGIPTVAIGCWIGSLVTSSTFWSVLIGIPALILIAAGCAIVLWRGDPRPSQYQGLAGIWIALLALPSAFYTGWGALLILALALTALAVSGWQGLRDMPRGPTAPYPEVSLALCLKCGIDQAMLALFMLLPTLIAPEDADRIAAEAKAALEVFRKNGWDKDPASFHKQPVAPESVHFTPRKVRGYSFEQMRFTSGYTPHPELPGGDRYAGFHANREVSGTVFRHADKSRPWLVCVHGYGMGVPQIDFEAFNPQRLHHEQGYNLLMLTLPLHGVRKTSWLSGDRYMCGDLLDTFNAQAQATSDLRQGLAWVRQQGDSDDAPEIRVIGFSLGGLNAAILAALDPEIEQVIAVVPLSDIANVFWHHSPSFLLQAYVDAGINKADAQTLFAPISPLQMPVVVPKEKRLIIAGRGDIIIPPNVVCDLWEHWDRPAINWFNGSHMSCAAEKESNSVIRKALSQ
ncbi:MAG: dienelactone hydrolase [Pseudoalteromonas tetraodonis]|jgi:dienelactone hydrolase